MIFLLLHLFLTTSYEMRIVIPATPPETMTAYATAYICQDRSCKNAMGKTPTFTTIACPRRFPLGTRFRFMDYEWVCEDRTNIKYDGRYDIFSGFGGEAEKEALRFGIQKVEVVKL